ncbi:hypothetical protein BKA62DRAFT_682512 [Auriculariales sp. MPI-PUGE-AT-0066]|nr:hypothetical protein BKA62DRAFT_682512 [Auriculariales sp. MPI-PUGE-AT-0066]
MAQEWLIAHALALPILAAGASVLTRAHRLYQRREAAPVVAARLFEFDTIAARVVRAGGLELLAWKLVRLACTITLVGLAAATLATRDYDTISLNHGAFAFRWDGPNMFQWSTRSRIVNPVVEHFWLDFALLVVFIYSAIMSAHALVAELRKARSLHTHLAYMLFVAWLAYAARDLFPLGTYTLEPLDLTDPFLWTKLAILTIAGVVVPLCIPHIYIPINPDKPTVLAPEQNSSWLSFVTFSFLDPLVWKGYTQPHVPWDELPPLADYDTAEYLRARAFPELDPFELRRAGKKKRHLFFHLIYLFRAEYAFLTFAMAFRVVASLIAPIGLNRLLHYLETDGSDAVIRPWVWIIWLFLGPWCSSVVWEGYVFTTTRMLVRTESIITQLVFEHALKIRIREDAPQSSGDKGSTDATASRKSANLVGRINNLVTTDLNNFIDARDFLFILVYCPLQIVFCIWFLYEVLGAAYVTFSQTRLLVSPAMVVTFPIPGWVATKVNAISKERAKRTDARVQEVTETMNLLRMIKLFAWEPRVQERLSEKREEELHWIWKTRVMTLVNMNLKLLVTMIVAYATYTLVMHRALSSSAVFSSMVVFELLRAQFRALGYQLPAIIQGKVSLERLDAFLSETELLDQYAENADYDIIPAAAPENPLAIGFRDAKFRWTARTASTDSSATSSGVPSGAQTPISPISSEATVVVPNSSGSGKRNFNLRIPGNVEFKRGGLNLVVGGTGSGKTSLLLALCGELHFEREGPSSWYGLPRSGGVAYAAQEGWVQNATIRENVLFGAPYDAERYAKVLKQCALERDLELFEAGDATEVGEKGLTLSGGQRARVTLARAIYSQAETILLDDCLAALDIHTSKWIVDKCFQGDLVQGRTIILVTHNVLLVADLAVYTVSLNIDGRVIAQGTPDEVLQRADSKFIRRAEEAIEAVRKVEEAVDENPTGKEPETKAKASGKLIVAEEIATGHVGWDALMLYFSSLGGVGFWLVYLGGILASNVVIVIQTWFLGYWASQYDSGGHVNDGLFVGGYGLSVLLSLSIYSIAFLAFLLASMRSSRTLHNKLISSILGTTLRWLDVVPTSRVIARATQDIRSVDGPVGNNFTELVELTAAMLLRLPGIPLPSLLMAYFAWFCGQLYIRSQLSVKREMSNMRAPVLGHFGAAIAGLSSIRAYGAEEAFKEEARRRIDTYTRAARSYYNLNRWISIRVTVLGGVFSAALASYMLYGQRSDASTTGFSLSLATSAFISSQILFWTRVLNQFEVEGNSLERIQQYIDIEQEPKPTDQGKPLPRYARDGPLVLKDVNFTLKSGERVGVVGRTGSGKSSLTLSLLRAIFTSGRVSYDGLDTSKLNLDALRSNITIIPQQPELLSGTLRQNLDPFEQHDDAFLNDALRASGLFALQEESEEGRITLDTSISSGGGNLSLGQRQIIALAPRSSSSTRRRPQWTMPTDTAIQESIRRELKDVTLITVAHRLRTIMDADKIMVLEAGQLVEFDSPSELLKKRTGLLRALRGAVIKADRLAEH